MNKFKQTFIYTVIFTFIVCFLFVFLLALTNEVTREQVALNELLSQRRAVLSAVGIPFANDAEVQERFGEIEEIAVGDVLLYSAMVDGRRVYAKQFAGAGLWGTIYGVLGVDETVSTTTGLEIINQNETPGLGGRIVEDWFKMQLSGEAVVDGRIIIGRGGDGDDDYSNGEIDGITGATRTSDSMEIILINELQALSAAIGEL